MGVCVHVSDCVRVSEWGGLSERMSKRVCEKPSARASERVSGWWAGDEPVSEAVTP